MHKNSIEYGVLVMLRLVMLGLEMQGLFPIYFLVWRVKDSFVFTHAYPCVNSLCIANTMVCYVLVLHPIILNRVCS